MIYREIGDVRVPALGLGTHELLEDECVEAVLHAIELGYRHIDTAPTYNNEEHIGRAIRESGIERSELFLTTKVWWEEWSFEEVQRSAEASLEKLGTEYVDLLLSHWPHPDEPIDEPLEALMALQDAGMTKNIGVSNFTPEQLAEACHLAPIICNQVEYHPFLDQEPLKVIIRENNLLLLAYSPLAQGAVQPDDTLRRIGEKYGKTPFQVTLRWHLQQARVAAVPKASNREHRIKNLDVFDFKLTDVEMAEIFALHRSLRLVDPEFAPAWHS